MALPDRVVRATSAQATRRETVLTGPVKRGDIRRVDPLSSENGERRICLVLRIDSTREAAEVMLGHPDFELATDHDVVLPRGDTDIPYSMVFQTDIRGMVWLTQVGPLVGNTDPEVLEQIGNLALGNPVASNTDVGLPLSGAIDPRWAFKVSEGEAMAALASDCTGALIDDDSPWQLDPGLFSPELLSGAIDVDTLLIDLMRALHTRIIQFDLEDVEILDRLGALSLDRWMSTFGNDLGRSFFEALQPLINGALASATLCPNPTVPNSDSWRPARSAIAAIASPSPRLDKLITASHLWLGETNSIRQVVPVEGEKSERSIDVLLVGQSRAR
jgi:hypothetical protein